MFNGRVESQYKITLSRERIGFIDIIYFKPDEITVIELKREVIKKIDVSQLTEYVDRVKDTFPECNVYGIIAGQEINNENKHSLTIRGFKFKKYFRDIPLQLKLCLNCRKAVGINEDKCKWCDYEEFITF